MIFVFITANAKRWRIHEEIWEKTKLKVENVWFWNSIAIVFKQALSPHTWFNIWNDFISRCSSKLIYWTYSSWWKIFNYYFSMIYFARLSIIYQLKNCFIENSTIILACEIHSINANLWRCMHCGYSSVNKWILSNCFSVYQFNCVTL